jgi:hypothetical protein
MQQWCRFPAIKGKSRRKRRQLFQNGWFLNHDNAPAHTALSIQEFLA